MKLTIMRPVTVEVDAIRCVVPVNYGTEDMPEDYPHRTRDTWDVTFDVATGQIRDWPEGVEPLGLHMKVVDGGRYYIMCGNGIVASMEEEYVPDCFPGTHYGDYLIFDIDASGRITNWQQPGLVELAESFGLSNED